MRAERWRVEVQKRRRKRLHRHRGQAFKSQWSEIYFTSNAYAIVLSAWRMYPH